MLQEMTGVFAEYERTMITERGRRGRLYHARQGQIWMKEGPCGYTYIPRTGNCPGKLVINEAEADVVRGEKCVVIEQSRKILEPPKSKRRKSGECG